MANQISEITRQNIFDFIKIESFVWSGRLNDVEFLCRLFKLDEFESYDSRYENAAGDIWQHRINNPFDWDDYWVFSDNRFNLLRCDDVIFLNFLCEMVHPLVRSDSQDINKLLLIFNDNLIHDNYEIVEKSKISGKSIYIGRLRIASNDFLIKRDNVLKEILNAEYVTNQIHLMEVSIESSPHVSIGIAKELIETCCKSILEDRLTTYDNNWDLIKLLKETTKLLKLTPEDISNEVKASKSIKQILGSLSSVVQGISEIRNEYGSGHGRNGNFKGLQPRHAKLAVGAASTLAIYLFESHLLKK